MKRQLQAEGKSHFHSIPSLFLILVLFAGPLLADTIIYVDDDANSANADGKSWATAYKCLQDALTEAKDANKPVQVLVAKGIYRPDQGSTQTPGDRTASFELVSGVILKGGYAGLVMADPNVCDPELYRTHLSGDLAGDDLLVPDPCDFVPLEGEQIGCVPRSWCFQPTQWSLMLESTRRENSRHVVTTKGDDQGLSLAGVMITGGNAYVTFTRYGDVVSYDEEEKGGGILNQALSLTLRDCMLAQNSCFGIGGGLYSTEDCHLVLDNCQFLENYSDRIGGGLYCAANGVVSVDRCVFNRNVVDDGSGIAVYSDTCTMQLRDCTFVGNRNQNPNRGVPIIYFNRGSLDLDLCVFRDNLGPGVSCSQAEAFFNDCLFQNNTSGTGGALYLRRSDVSIEDCLFINNRADHGGAIYASGNSADISNVLFLKNSIFSGNHASNDGGALISKAIATVIENCTFSNNRSILEGGALVCTIGVELATTNSIFEGNFSPAGMNAYIGQSYLGTHPSSMSVQYCLIEGGQDSIALDSNCTLVWGEGNLDADPLFVDPGYWDINSTSDDPNDDFYLAGDFHLQSQAGHWSPNSETWIQDNITSPCIDAGDPNTPVGLEPSPNGDRINMGAYGGTVEASKSHFGKPPCPLFIAGDINGDCRVDFLDLVILASHWLEQGID